MLTGRWKPWALTAWLVVAAGMAVAQSPADAVVQQLRAQGYVEFAVSRTLLGRVRVMAVAPDGSQREIVFNPTTGEILRDYSEPGDSGAAPRILDRSGDAVETRTEAPPSVDNNGGAPQPLDGDDGGAPQPDGNHGHGNDPGGFDSDNAGQGHGTDGTPGGGNADHPGNGNSDNPSRGDGNGKG
jgi:hypothetical protein